MQAGETVVRIGLPAVNDAGTEALSRVFSRRRGLGSADRLLYLVKDPSGAWTIVGSNLLGAS